MKWILTTIFLSSSLMATAAPLSQPQKDILSSIKENNIELVNEQLAKVEDLNFGKRLSPLGQAIKNQNLELITLLLDNGADINYFGKQLNSHLMQAILLKNDDIIDLILKQSPDLEVASRSVPFRTPIMQSAADGNLALTKRLFEAGAKLDSKDIYQDEPLAFAAAYGTGEVVEFMISKGAKINHQNQAGNTPLNHSITTNNESTQLVLIAANAKTSAQLEN